MRRASLCILFCALALMAGAQNRFGLIAYNEALQATPEYADARAGIEKLRAQYDAEMKRAEEEFNRKYEEFLEGRADFAPSIRNKRQSELQELMQKNLAFKEEARRLLRQAEQEAMAPAHKRLASAIADVSRREGLSCVFNTDAQAVPYADPAQGLDITEYVKQSLSQ